MNIGGLKELQIALGNNGRPAVGQTYASALKKAAGVTGRKFDVDAVVTWFRRNPNFNSTMVYPKRGRSGQPRRNPASPPVSTVGR
jgi:hypothetical protein